MGLKYINCIVLWREKKVTRKNVLLNVRKLKAQNRFSLRIVFRTDSLYRFRVINCRPYYEWYVFNRIWDIVTRKLLKINAFIYYKKNQNYISRNFNKYGYFFFFVLDGRKKSGQRERNKIDLRKLITCRLSCLTKFDFAVRVAKKKKPVWNE